MQRARCEGTPCAASGFLPDGAVCSARVVDLEGEFVAKKLNAMGVAAFVLRSRLARAEGSTYQVEVESLADLHQAICVVRQRAAKWGVNPARVGVMGFSARGHLAALAENKFDAATRPELGDLGLLH